MNRQPSTAARPIGTTANAVDRFKAGAGRIDIGTFQSVSSVILPVVVRRLRDEHPDCDIRLSEEEPDQPRIGELDLLFYDGLVESWCRAGQAARRPVLPGGRRGRFPRRAGPVGGARRRADGGVALTCDQPLMEQALAGSGARPRIVFRSAINDTLLSMVRAGMGSTVLPWLAIQGADAQSDPRLQVHELRPSLPPREIYLHWPAGRSQSPLAARAIEIAVEVAGEIAADPAGA